MQAHRVVASFALLLPPCLLAGCHIDTHNRGGNDDVSIGTPFGSVHVKTDESAAMARIGLTPYPGAVAVHKDGEDSSAADVNLSFGSFKLGVHAADLKTTDDQDKVLAFYRKDMGRYGAVLTCRGGHTVDTPTRTADGLTCNSDRHSVGGDELQLRAGSPLHQHIVGISPEGGGTRIGLVALDLPAGMHGHDADSRE